MGRHPFSGTYKGAGDQLSISKAIQEGRFAYSPQTSLTQMIPPPHVPLLADIPFEVGNAFQRAFGSPNEKSPVRPTAAEWVPILERMDKGIIDCKANPAHHFSRNAPNCPWCRFEGGLGIVLFLSPQTASRSSFDLISVLAKIERIQSPGSAPALSSLLPAPAEVKPSVAAQKFRTRLWARKIVGLVAAGVALVLMLTGMGWGFVFFIPAGFLFFGEVSGRGALREQRTKAQGDWKRSLEDWNQTAGNGLFDRKKSRSAENGAFVSRSPFRRARHAAQAREKQT